MAASQATLKGKRRGRQNLVGIARKSDQFNVHEAKMSKKRQKVPFIFTVLFTKEPCKNGPRISSYITVNLTLESLQRYGIVCISSLTN